MAFDRQGADGGGDVAGAPAASLELYWIPLGAGNRTVQFSGRTFEALTARRDRRPPCNLYHSALVARLDADRYYIEMTPAPGSSRAAPLSPAHHPTRVERRGGTPASRSPVVERALTDVRR